MNCLKVTGRSTRFFQRKGSSSLTKSFLQQQQQRQLFRQQVRLYSTPTPHVKDSGSNIPWAIGSLLVFGPILFKLTSPPPSKKRSAINHDLTQHVSPAEAAADKKPAGENDRLQTPPIVSVVEKSKIQKPYVLIGAGTASFAAAKAIKEKDPQANVIIIGDEAYAPYMRPPLSKELWFSEKPEVENLTFKDWSGKERNTIYQNISEYELISDASGSDIETNDKIKLLLNKSVTKLNIDDHTVTLNDGSMIYYNKVLLATGGEPKTLPNQPAADSKHITTFRNISDFKTLDKVAKDGAHIAVIGGGFLGSELAVALAHRAGKENLKVTQIFPEDGNMAKVFPAYLTKWTTGRVRKLGVNVKEKCSVESIYSSKDEKTTIQLSNGETVEVDHVIIAIGIKPRVDLARDAGLEIDEKHSGVVVNAELEARTDVYAAGDMVSFHDIQLGRRRIEHHDHAVLSGRHAGENMVGGHRAYKHQSMFWSDLGPEIGYEAVGLVDSQLSTVSVWAKATKEDTPAAAAASTETSSPRLAPGETDVTSINTSTEDASETTQKNDVIFKDEKFGKGLVFYTRDQKIVGLVLFNVFGKVQEARDIISSGYTTDQIDSLVKKFDIFSKDH
ncbi:apoptosis-inducing factor, mitochondrion-associated, C-term-domain-containing protein [Mycotypha africana]|uniref:apoptosis-inducing factor, mitochondrion-associated, C-term-domain-containing protein n=1 Tax=Mycotypha africana TaxID=64632 RepID=UPI00230141D5|nr:apoptosis-inducing factor, mitochondrion-associated, C-term-domain-containing protein [Mycotypha africana]KAI8987638.1 apoptosis-inducing factor, mitochondrion-associated, C-term-domain-containing protein [Mycotypha africana]